MPVAAASLLLLPAALPLLSLLTVLVLASLPWWLHLPVTGKPLLIPLFLLATPLLGFFGCCALWLLPVVLICLFPIFCLLPVLVLATLPLLAFTNTALAVPLL